MCFVADEPGADSAVEQEPDYRFTLANERTFLAWQADRAMRRGDPLPRHPTPGFLAVGLIVVGLIALALVIAKAVTG
jgi:putative membrane protein